MTKTVKMVLDRDYLLRSTLGHMVNFHKNVPLNVPAIMVRAAADIGAKRVDGEDAAEAPPETEDEIQPIDPGHRLEDVEAAIGRIVERNDVDDFTAGGTPKTAAVSKEVGYKVDFTEVKKVWEQRNED